MVKVAANPNRPVAVGCDASRPGAASECPKICKSHFLVSADLNVPDRVSRCPNLSKLDHRAHHGQTFSRAFRRNHHE
eukprot:scaffold385137_cov38-Prasinocladus_malaysianus.AAC.2